MTIEERVTRLERCLMGLAALLTGEVQAVGTPEEITAMQEQLGKDFSEMAKGLKL